MLLRTFKQPGGRWVGHTASVWETKTDKFPYSLPDGTFDIAKQLGVVLAEVAARD